ncbi:hypothetical protein Tco_1493509 [Tanacetum coccineum]
MNSENGNDKVNMPLFPSLEPTVSYFDDLDHFKDFENKFPAIVYYDALTSKLDFLTEPTVSPQHIDEFNLKDETSLFECDEREQNVFFNDLFPLNVIYPDDLKSDKDNDDDEIQSSGGGGIWHLYHLEIRDTRGSGTKLRSRPRISCTTSSIYLRRYLEGQSTGCTDFAGLTEGMRQTLAGGARCKMTWRKFPSDASAMVRPSSSFFRGYYFFSIMELVLHTTEEMVEDGFQAYWLGSERVTLDKGELRNTGLRFSFLAEDRHLRRHARGRKSGARLSEGHFIGRLAAHFGLVSDEGLKEKEGGVFKRLGSRGKSLSTLSDNHNQRSYSRYTEALSESKDSGGGHWKSRSNKKKSNGEEDDLS